MPRKATKSRKSGTGAGRKTSTKRATKVKTTVKYSSVALKEPLRKTQMMSHIADETQLSKKQVSEVFEALERIIERHLKKGSAGEFAIPGLIKFVVKRKPATKARKGINPFTGDEIMIKAKPSRNVVKVRPLKKLKEMVE